VDANRLLLVCGAEGDRRYHGSSSRVCFRSDVNCTSTKAVELLGLRMAVSVMVNAVRAGGGDDGRRHAVEDG